MKDPKEYFGLPFIYKLMHSMHLKLYDFSETKEQLDQREEFKKDFRMYFAKKLEDEIEDKSIA